MIAVPLARRPLMVALLVIALLASLVFAPGTAHASDDAAEQAEREFVALVNVERARAGLGAVIERTDIRSVARGWSATMASRWVLAHNPDYSEQITGWQRVSENVGYGPSVEAIHTALMASDGHRRNILDDRVSEIGVGVAFSGGRVWVTQNFRRPLSDFTLASPSTTIFGDVSSTSVHAAAIDKVVSSGIEAGCTAVRFCPDGSVTRGQFASMLVRAMDIPPTTEQRFTDTSGIHAADIEALAAAGITSGCGPAVFCPDQRLSRAHIASFLARSLGYEPAGSPFVDAPDNHAWAIGALYSRSIVKGCSTTRFCPDETVSRAQTASILARTFD